MSQHHGYDVAVPVVKLLIDSQTLEYGEKHMPGWIYREKLVGFHRALFTWDAHEVWLSSAGIADTPESGVHDSGLTFTGNIQHYCHKYVYHS
jgi:hypothetical protein